MPDGLTMPDGSFTELFFEMTPLLEAPSTSYATTSASGCRSWQRPIPLGRCTKRMVACFSQSRNFRHNFDPSKGGAPQDPRFMRPAKDSAESTVLTNNLPPPLFEGPDPPGSFRVRNPFAQHTRLMPANIPTPSKLPFPFKEEEYYRVDIQQKQQGAWPSFTVGPNGQLTIRPGMLDTVADPTQPEFVLMSGIERFRFSAQDKVLHTAVAAVYMVALGVAFAALWAANHNLALILGLNWALDSLSIPKIALFGLLAWSGKLWLFWVFFAGSLVDKLLERIAPPIRQVAWMAFAAWMAYIVLTPVYVHPLPWI